MKENKMRGRDIYNLFRPILLFGTLILRVMPRSFSKILYLIVRPVPTKLGIAMRYIIISRLARKCGECVAIYENVYLPNIDKLELGDHISIHPMCYLDASGGLKIGSHVSIAHASTVMTTEHSYNNHLISIRDAPVIYAPVTIENNVWIGCGVRILAGTSIGSGSVVGAGAVVTKDVDAGTICVGVPARPVKTISNKAA